MATKTNKKTVGTKPAAQTTPSLLERMETEVQSNQSRLSLVLGGLIVIVVGILVFNYFNKDTSKSEISQAGEKTESKEDVAPTELPGKYTVKEGDTLFTIAQKYYQDGYKFDEIAKVNNLANADMIEVGQVLDIPRLAITNAPEQTPTPVVLDTAPQQNQTVITDFGSPITGDKYTVVDGDWLSTISARAYNGEIMSYDKIAKANNITDPNLIEPGMVLTIPR